MPTWKVMTYFAFSLPHEPGSLAKFVDVLRNDKINLIGLWGHSPAEEESRFACVPEAPELFRAVAGAEDIDVEEGKTFYLCQEDQPGALVETLQRIGESGINLDSIEAVGTGDRFGCFLWASQENWEKLEVLLAKQE